MKLKTFTLVLATILSTSLLWGCKYYGSALRPDYPLSMDDALAIARDHSTGAGGVQRTVMRKEARPNTGRPAYVPEVELAVVAPPKTLLVWTYPHVTEDNTRVFGNWSTIFLTDRYEWVRPANEQSLDDEPIGGAYGALQ